MRTVFLTDYEIAALLCPDPVTASEDGWQALLTRLALRVDRTTGRLHLDTHDLHDIPRYALDSGNADWEARLRLIFERSLGPSLGRILP